MARLNDRSKRVGVLRVAIVEQIATVAKGAPSVHGHVPGHLLHPSIIRLAGNPRDVHLAALKVDEKEHVIRHKTAQREDLHQAAKDFLRWMHSKPVFGEWFTSQQGYSDGATRDGEKDKVWDADPVLLPFRDIPPFGRLPGYAGPPNRKAAEVVTKYIITDIYAPRRFKRHAGRGGGAMGA
jgi:hypothetical protein